MKKLLVFSVFLALFLVPLTLVFAQEKVEQRNVVLPAGETVNADYFNAGNSVTISGTVNGDVFVAGGEVLIEGVVNGDLIAAGGTVNIRGEVKDDVRVAGGQVTISGKVGRNVTVGAGFLNITDSASIGRNLTAGAGSISLFGTVGKDLKIGAGTITLGNEVKGDVEAGVGNITLTSKAKVGGNLTYWSENDANIQTGAVVTGTTTKKAPPQAAKEAVSPTGVFKVAAGANIAFKIIGLISSLILGLIFLKFMPVHTQRVADTLQARALASLGLGFIGLILTPIIFILLLVSIVGIPLAFVFLAAFGILVYLTKIAVSLWLGEKVLSYFGVGARRGWGLLVGLIIYALVTLIPIFGGIIAFLVLLFGIGAIILAEKASLDLLTEKKIA